ncbi:MAG: hypothetical protein JNN09_07300 [Alphaproteobacteria bacterium]|nr:hypothetical protein [Alphaproteobacteria bacterium]
MESLVVSASQPKEALEGLPLLVNRDVIAGRVPYSFAAHYLLGVDGQGRRLLEFLESRAGVVMSKPDKYQAWLKSEFMKLQDPNAPEEILARARKDFGVESNQDLANLCTVGCGTNVLFRLSDGVFYASVERTAPKQTDAGAVNPGAYSRAAGSSTGDLTTTALRELNEELFIVIRLAGKPTALHIIPELYQGVGPQQKQAILETRRDRFSGILEANGHQISLTNHFEMCTPCLSVPSLTEAIVERTPFGDNVLEDRVFGHSPDQMDVNVVDAITVVDLPFVSSSDVICLLDGEKNQKGDLLMRKWVLRPLDEMHRQLTSGEITMSPVPGRVVRAKDDVLAALHQKLEI